MTELKRGVLIAIEGIDGSGKSTLAQHLYKTLVHQKKPVLLTKEPGGSPLGKHLRSLLQEKPIAINSKAEYLLFAADRAQHFQEIVQPALEEGTIVLSDRLADSSLVYQGYGRGLDLTHIASINQWAMNGIEPDLVLYVRIDAKKARERLINRGKLSAFDQESSAFFDKLVDGFETLYKDKENLLVLDGTLPEETLADQAIMALNSWLIQNR